MSNVFLGFSNEPLVYLALTISTDPNSVFRVVFTRDSKKEIDVIAKILSNDYTLCTRRHSTNIESSNLGPEIPNGYLCAHEFFSNEIILKSLARVLTKGEGNTKYPSPYVGNLYPDFKGLLLWPITSGKKKYISATSKYVSISI